jgi:hypothetical protein
MKVSRIVWAFAFSLAALCLSCIYSEAANDSAAESLRQRLITEKFGELYKNSSALVHGRLTEQEFIEKMRAITLKLKDIDPEIHWIRDLSLRGDTDVFSEKEIWGLRLERNAKLAFVQIDWEKQYQLCGIYVFDDIHESTGIGFRNCD